MGTTGTIHSHLGISNLGRFNYATVSCKLVGPREWTATRYYVGQVRQQENTILYSAQRRYMAWLGARSPRISIHYGRLEQRPRNDAAAELKRYLAELKVRIDASCLQGPPFPCRAACRCVGNRREGCRRHACRRYGSHGGAKRIRHRVSPFTRTSRRPSRRLPRKGRRYSLHQRPLVHNSRKRCTSSFRSSVRGSTIASVNSTMAVQLRVAPDVALSVKVRRPNESAPPSTGSCWRAGWARR